MVHADHRGGQNEIGLKEADRIINGSNNSSGLSMTSMPEPVRGVPAASATQDYFSLRPRCVTWMLGLG
jgi:hypothetical protein